MRIIPILLFIACFALGPVFGLWAEGAAGVAAGAAEVNLLNAIFNGPIGFALGLAVATAGIYTVAMGNMSRGITLIILGVLITLTPGVFNSMRSLFVPMAQALFQ